MPTPEEPTGPEQAEFRRRLAAWLDEHAPAKGSADDFSAAHLSAPRSLDDYRQHEVQVIGRARRWQRQLFDAGWAGLSWPEAYGGAGRHPIYDAIVADEQTRYGVSTKPIAVGLQMVSAVLFAHADAAQRERYLPAILRADEVWCQLFSEPGAGSDLPSVTTSAVPIGEGWRVNGQKVWNSSAGESDWGLALVRTEPGSVGRQGLSCVIVDMHAPGVDARPLRQMSGSYHFCEVFLTDVTVERDNVVDDLGTGWTVARTMLKSERASIGGGTAARSAGQLIELARQLGLDRDPQVRQRLAAAHTRETILDLLLQRLGDGVPAPGNLVKLLYSDHARRSADDGVALLGPAATAWDDDRSEVWRDRFLFAPGLRIAGGTDEIQRNQIAELGLALPREPRPGA